MDRLAADLVRVLGDRFVALVAYSPTRAAGFATQVTATDLDGLAPLVERWHREGLETPLLLTPTEFLRSLDAFPLEYDAILTRHILIAGTVPFGSERPSESDVRRACEIEAKAFLIHLRQGWLHAGSDTDAQRAVLAQSAAPLRALLVNVARLERVPFADDGDLAAFGESRLGGHAALVRRVLALDHHPEGADAMTGDPAFMADYLRVAEMLWAFVDRWRA